MSHGRLPPGAYIDREGRVVPESEAATEARIGREVAAAPMNREHLRRMLEEHRRKIGKAPVAEGLPVARSEATGE